VVTGPAPAPKEHTLRSLVNARNMLQRVAASRAYTSRLPCSQVWDQASARPLFGSCLSVKRRFPWTLTHCLGTAMLTHSTARSLW
jgi:hypothetical protein